MLFFVNFAADFKNKPVATGNSSIKIMNKQRRKDLVEAKELMEQTLDLLDQAKTIVDTAREEEDESLFNLPVNLQESVIAETMGDNIDTLVTIIDLIDDIYTVIGDGIFYLSTITKSKSYD